MAQQRVHNTSSLRSAHGSWGTAQIAAVPNRVVLDIDSRNFDTAGHAHHEHALLSLTVADASELRDAINAAIMQAAAGQAMQSGVWGDTTHRTIVRRSSRRVA